MIEVEKALGELKRRLEETQRYIRLESNTTRPSVIKIRSLEHTASQLHSKLAIMQALRREVKELERTVSFKMMTRYPENQPYRTELKRELHRTSIRLKTMAKEYQPKEKEKPRWAA